MFSICLCSWNDLKFLKLLYGSIKKYTKVPYELIIHDNGSEDGTELWLKENGIKYSRSEKNEGVAAVNYAVKQAKYDYIVDINADMVVLPSWDTEILKQRQKFKKEGIDKYTISSCLIEPSGNNAEYDIVNCGISPESFNEDFLLSSYLKLSKKNTIQYSHPITMPKHLWNEFGGVDTSYPMGKSTDHDIAASAYNIGCRHFVMLGTSRVFHFVSQTLSKLPKSIPDGQSIFEKKWGMTIEQFRNTIGIRKTFTMVK